MAAARQVSSPREVTDLSSNISNSHTELSFMPATAMQRGGHSSSSSSRDTTPKVRKCRSGAIREGRRLRRRRPLPTSKAMGTAFGVS